MESHRITELADKFWKGECSEKEELELRQALLYGEVPQGMEELVDYMRFIDRQKDVAKLDDDFDKAILEKIEGDVRTQSQGAYFMRIAAGLAILLCVGYGIYNMSRTQPVDHDLTAWEETYDDPEEAYREVKKALLLVSNTMNEGMEPTVKLAEFHKAHEQIENHLK